MPFWHGDRPGRPPEFGRAIGELARTLTAAPRREAVRKLTEDHGLDRRAAANLRAYLDEQAEATGDVPSDRTIVVERYLDEVGDWRVCILSPFGARVHAPWATAVLARLRESRGSDAEMLWSDDGIVFRLPESEEPPDVADFLPPAESVEDLVTRNLGSTSLFAARFRENAARALLLPRRHPGRRSPLWAQRKRAADLLSVASRYGSFPILLETYRECLRDVFDLPGSGRDPPADRQPPHPGGHGGLPRPLPVRGVAPLLLGRELHLRRGRSARGAARPGALGRPGAAEGAPGRGGAARAPRRARHRGARAQSPAAGRPAGLESRRAPRSAPVPRRPDRGGDPRPVGAAGGRRAVARASVRRAPGDCRDDRRRASVCGRGGCGAPARRSRHSAAARVAGVVPRGRRGSPGRPRLAVGADARPVPGGGPRGALRPSDRADPRGARTPGAGGPRRRGRVPAGRTVAGVVRRRRPEVVEAPVAREASQGGRAGRRRGVLAIPARVAGSGASPERARRSSLRDRAAAGRRDAGFRPGDRDPSGAPRELQAGGPGPPLRRRGSPVARRGSGRAARRPGRALPSGSLPSPRSASGSRRGRPGGKDPGAARAPGCALLLGPRGRDRRVSRGSSSTRSGISCGRGR